MEEIEKKEQQGNEVEFLLPEKSKNVWLKRFKIDDFKFELILFFVLGFLLGFTLKTEAAKKITIGFNDYKVLRAKQDYDFDKVKKDLEQKAVEQTETNKEQQ